MDGPLCEICVCLLGCTSLSLPLSLFLSLFFTLTWFPLQLKRDFYSICFGTFWILSLAIFLTLPHTQKRVLWKYSIFCRNDIFYHFILTLIFTSYNVMGNVTLTSLGLFLSPAADQSFSTCTFPASWCVDKISVRKWLEERLKKRLWGRGNVLTHTNTKLCIHTYCKYTCCSMQLGKASALMLTNTACW